VTADLLAAIVALVFVGVMVLAATGAIVWGERSRRVPAAQPVPVDGRRARRPYPPFDRCRR